MQITASMRRHPGRTAAIAVALLAIAGVALYWFAPWNLFVDKRVDEALPGATRPAAGAGGVQGQGTGDDPGASNADGLVTLAEGAFASLEHETTGMALVVELPDGTRYLRLEGLETSNGPDLRVYLSSVPPSDDWYVYDDDAFVDLGGLKGNLGSSNYAIPRGTDLSGFRSAVIWCRRFSVGFGVAPLDVAA
jgi:hypothetical protein